MKRLLASLRYNKKFFEGVQAGDVEWGHEVNPVWSKDVDQAWHRRYGDNVCARIEQVGDEYRFVVFECMTGIVYPDARGVRDTWEDAEVAIEDIINLL